MKKEISPVSWVFFGILRSKNRREEELKKDRAYLAEQISEYKAELQRIQERHPTGKQRAQEGGRRTAATGGGVQGIPGQPRKTNIRGDSRITSRSTDNSRKKLANESG